MTDQRNGWRHRGARSPVRDARDAIGNLAHDGLGQRVEQQPLHVVADGLPKHELQLA